MAQEFIGRYNIIAEIGRGGMSTVYRAYDPLFEREVAIKVLPHALQHDATFKPRFEREAKTIASLEHPSIVPVYDFGEEDGQPYIVMRLMTGGSLADRIARGALTLKESAAILRQLAPALDEVHERGMVHRDLKPGNILFDQRDVPYLTDFGLAKITEAASSLTGNMIIGTPAYMSPEQARGDHDLDGRSDIYSMGAILFEMLTGRTPYEADTPMGQVVKHITEPIPDITRFRAKLPRQIQTVMAQAMAKRKEARYASMQDFAQAVSLLAAGRTLPELPQTMSLPRPNEAPAAAGDALSPRSREAKAQASEPVLRPAASEKPASTPGSAAHRSAPHPDIEPKKYLRWSRAGIIFTLILAAAGLGALMIAANLSPTGAAGSGLSATNTQTVAPGSFAAATATMMSTQVEQTGQALQQGVQASKTPTATQKTPTPIVVTATPSETPTLTPSPTSTPSETPTLKPIQPTFTATSRPKVKAPKPTQAPERPTNTPPPVAKPTNTPPA